MKRRFLPLILVAAVTLVLALAVSGFVRNVIVVPVVYAGWLTWLALINLPQWIFWSMLVAVIVILALRSLPGTTQVEPGRRPESAPPAGPVSNWYDRLSQRSSQTTTRWRISRDLGHIFWEARFPEEAFQMQGFLDRIEDPSVAMPNEIRDYFEAGLARPQPSFRSWFRWRRRDAASPLDLDPMVVVGYLEETFDLANPTRSTDEGNS